MPGSPPRVSGICDPVIICASRDSKGNRSAMSFDASANEQLTEDLSVDVLKFDGQSKRKPSQSQSLSFLRVTG